MAKGEKVRTITVGEELWTRLRELMIDERQTNQSKYVRGILKQYIAIMERRRAKEAAAKSTPSLTGAALDGVATDAEG